MIILYTCIGLQLHAVLGLHSSLILSTWSAHVFLCVRHIINLKFPISFSRLIYFVPSSNFCLSYSFLSPFATVSLLHFTKSFTTCFVSFEIRSPRNYFKKYSINYSIPTFICLLFILHLSFSSHQSSLYFPHI